MALGSDSHDEGVAKMCDQVFHFRSRYVAETGVTMTVGPFLVLDCYDCLSKGVAKM